jgi:hypothetical protein
MPLLFEKARCIFADRKRAVTPDVGNPLYINKYKQLMVDKERPVE